MKTHTIDIDEKTWNYLKSNAEPFEDTPNSVLSRLLFKTGIPVKLEKKFEAMITGIPGVPKKIPQALSQVLEVIFEMKMAGRSRIDECVHQYNSVSSGKYQEKSGPEQ